MADVFNALTSNRPYRRPGKAEEALAYLESQRVIRFNALLGIQCQPSRRAGSPASTGKDGLLYLHFGGGVGMKLWATPGLKCIFIISNSSTAM